MRLEEWQKYIESQFLEEAVETDSGSGRSHKPANDADQWDIHKIALPFVEADEEAQQERLTPIDSTLLEEEGSEPEARNLDPVKVQGSPSAGPLPA